MKITVKEPSVQETISILMGLKSYYEQYHNVVYSEKAIEAAVILSERYIQQKQLPDKAIDVLDEAGAQHKLKLNINIAKEVINVNDIELIISKIANLPVQSLTVKESKKLKHLENNLKKKIFGQNDAIEKVCSSIKLAKAGLRSSNKPIGCYLFCGPTGVGKTELARNLAAEIDMELLRFDMSEYSEKHSISRLIGSPPGYIGFEQAGLLTEQVSKSPYCVILLDEIEKANNDIYNLMLQVMDYGKLTDSHGKNVNFCNTIIIMTSNIGSNNLNKGQLGFGGDKEEYEKSYTQNETAKIFSPEFINRLDAIISFTPLTHDIILKIVDKELEVLKIQLGDKNIKIQVASEVKKYLAKEGYNRKDGARKLSHMIDNKIRRRLADEILFGKLSKGGHIKLLMLKDKVHVEIITPDKNEQITKTTRDSVYYQTLDC